MIPYLGILTPFILRGYWNHIPLIRYLIPLLSGIIVAISFKIHSVFWYYLFGSTASVYFIFQFIKKSSASFRLQFAFGCLLNIILFCSGVCIVIIRTPVYQHNYFMQDANDSTIFRCRIIQPPTETEKNFKLYVRADEQLTSNKNISVDGRSIIYLKKDLIHNLKFNYGDIIYIANHFSEPASPKNPDEFNYKNYLNHQGIYHIAFLKTEEVYITSEHHAKWQWKQIYACREYFIRLMDRYIKNENSKSVGEALILGTKSDIDAEVQQAYANTGTMHVLAVSGLHVGILYVILEFLFRPFKFFQKKRSRAALFKTIFILIIIWIYACLTGMSPSVMRSAVMFTFLALGRLYDRHVDSFNIIFVSMLPLLIVNPYQITQVGFQLSYLAVAGIVFFQPVIASVWKPGNKFLKYIWSLTSVSIAAQMATVPVSIYYFHQFPNYFLLSNMMAIPISFIVLILGVAFFVLGWIPYLNYGLGFLLDWSLRVLNGSVISVDRMPHAVTNNLFTSMAEMLLTYLAIIFLGAFIKLKQKKYLIAILITTCMITISISFRQVKNNNAQAITFYNTKSSSAILLNNGSTGFVFSDSDSLLLSEDYKYHLKNNLIRQEMLHPKLINYKNTNNDFEAGNYYYQYPFLLCGKTSFYFLSKSNQKDSVVHADEIDYVILTGDPFLKIDSTLQFKNATYIIDNSNSWKSSNYWKKAFDKNGIKYKCVKDESLTIKF